MVVSVSSVGSASGAAAYYAADNYYTADKAAELSEWGGEGAARLGLEGPVDAAQFEAVLSGRLPNGPAISGGGGEHRAGLDLTFSAPKSVSLVALLGGDQRVVAAHIAVVRNTMQWAESRLAEARQGANGNTTLETGNLVYALFPHDVSRAHDPQLHVHAVIANATQRPDGQWRALRNDALYKENTLIGAVYHAELRAALEKLGYGIVMTGKHGSFEIAGIDRATIEQWSTRRGDILAMAGKLEIGSPQGMRAVAERTREGKTEVEPDKLAVVWQALAQERGLNLAGLVEKAMQASTPRGIVARVHEWGRELVERITHAFGPRPEPLMGHPPEPPRGTTLAAAYAVAAGVRHMTERQATFAPGELLREALNLSAHGARVGEIEQRIERLIDRRVILQKEHDGQPRMTTRDVLRTETEIVARMQMAKNDAQVLVAAKVADKSLDTAAQVRGLSLSQEQREAAKAILSGLDRYQLVQGDAGSGKTTLFAMIQDVLAGRGHDIVALAPQHRLARELRDGAGLNAGTVAGFLVRHGQLTGKPNLYAAQLARQQLGGKVLLVDEASMLSHRQVLGLMQIADHAGIAKLVLVGDVKQIASPEAGRPFAMLQVEGAPIARLSENRRQLDPQMREAVAAARLGRTGRALDALGSRVTESRDPALAGAKAWLALPPEERSRTAILTSGHALRTQVLDHVRKGLIAEGALGKESLTLKTYENLNFTREQIRQIGNYVPGQRLTLYQQQSKLGLERGAYWVESVDPKKGEVLLSRDGAIRRFDPAKLSPGATRASLSVPSQIEVRQGDRLIWTTNDRQLGIANGTPVEVTRIQNGALTLKDATATRTLAPGNPLRQSLAHGLALNMHRAQGMTVDRAITVMSSHDRQLNSASLFYVLTSRAREHIALHVDSKDDLARSIGHHRGEIANAREVLGEAKLGKEREALAERFADANRVLQLPELEKKFDLSL
jgi:conjugative relaxase-like TrwC/TraI family protein